MQACFMCLWSHTMNLQFSMQCPMQDAVADAEGKPGARQLQEMLAAFLTNVEASLENGTLQAAEAVPASVAALQERKSLLVQLQSEQSLLQLRLQCFEQVHLHDTHAPK